MSVVPVWRPLRDHSVSPWRTMKQRGSGIFQTTSRGSECWGRRVDVDVDVDVDGWPELDKVGEGGVATVDNVSLSPMRITSASHFVRPRRGRSQGTAWQCMHALDQCVRCGLPPCSKRSLESLPCRDADTLVLTPVIREAGHIICTASNTPHINHLSLNVYHMRP
ncbi:hypothetical protein TMatcc_001537 [Talaromyces marneffei ATCC 18224]